MQRLIITHMSPDWDAITSVWIIKKFLPGWESAKIQFIPAGSRMEANGEIRKINSALELSDLQRENAIETFGDKLVIHVDTGFGYLDHHQTSDMNVCAASRCWDYVRSQNVEFKDMDGVKVNAVSEIIKYVVMLDHFQEVYFPHAADEIYEFGFYGLIEGYKMEFPNDDLKCFEFGSELLEAVMHRLQQRTWAQNEIKEKGVEFETKFGKCLAIESLNDDVVKLGQKMGYVLVVRRDSRKGYIRIKALPLRNLQFTIYNLQKEKEINIDLTPVYEKLKELDPNASWFLHVSKKMLLNGSAKSANMKSTKLSLDKIVEVIKECYN